MPSYTTPLGTNYSTYSTSIGSPVNGVVNWGFPDALIGASHIPMLFYTHGAGGNGIQFRDYSGWAGLRNWLMDNGWGWVESSGGGEQTWGNQLGRDAYAATWEHIKAQLSIGPVVILGRSMGALAAYWLYASHDELSNPDVCQGLIVNSGVTDLLAAYDSGEFDTRPAEAFGVDPGDRPAYVAAISGGYDPMDFSTTLWEGRRVLQCWATNDGTVPPADHGQAWRTAYGSVLSVNSLATTPTGGHTATGAYTLVSEMSDFLEDCAAEWTAPEPPPEFQEISEIKVNWGGTIMTPVEAYYQVDADTRVQIDLSIPPRLRIS